MVWDPFHTSPEELLAYVGLVPLFLAGMALFREWRRDPAVRLLAILFVVTLVLSLGPYVPGFRFLIGCRGFPFFEHRRGGRWPRRSRLALLAGKGFDGWPDWRRPGRSLRRFSLAAIVWVVAIVGLIELALVSTSQAGLADARPGLSARF